MLTLLAFGCSKPVGNEPTAAPAGNSNASSTGSTRQTTITDTELWNISAFMMNDDNKSHFLSWKNYENGGRQVAFSQSGKRYTIYFSGWADSNPVISFWTRPEGTSGQTSIETFTYNANGELIFGIKGGQDRKEYDGFIEGKGLENKPYWEKAGNDAKADTLAYMRR